MRRLMHLLLLAAGLWLLMALLLFVFQRSLLYFPQPRTQGGAEQVMLLPLTDARVTVTVRPVSGPRALIYFGGNAEDVSRSLPDFAEAFPDHALYLLHYRGFGDSGGEPTEANIQRDALALFDKVHALHRDVAVVGRSLGSGVALYLASRRPVSRLVLVTPYDSILDLARRSFPLFPVSWILRDRYESWRYAPAIEVPTLLLVAGRDEVIPRWSSDRLVGRFRPGVVREVVIPRAGHNDIGAFPEYLRLIRDALSPAPWTD